LFQKKSITKILTGPWFLHDRKLVQAWQAADVDTVALALAIEASSFSKTTLLDLLRKSRAWWARSKSRAGAERGADE
jgi:hypothetical protein